ncbi:MAG: hypothetical protein LBT46_03080 [Planctomycetaceae bacterium]|jgi:hypothetical protein|nr:hypothetical protein [Planctomycetaceae bacterium]
MPSSDSPFSPQITDYQQAILQELQAIHSTLKKQGGSRQSRRKSTVNNAVSLLLNQYPDRTWTSTLLAKSIGNGCTDAAVRKTKQWQAYQRCRQNVKSAQKNDRKKGNICYGNFDEIDEKLDSET